MRRCLGRLSVQWIGDCGRFSRSLTVWEEIDSGGSGDVLPMGIGEVGKGSGFRLFRRVKFLEALIAGNYKKVILSGQKVSQFLAVL